MTLMPPLGVYTKENTPHTQAHPRCSVLPNIQGTETNLRIHPWENREGNWSRYTMEYYLGFKKETLPFSTTGLHLEDILLSGINQTRKGKYCVISIICGTLSNQLCRQKKTTFPQAHVLIFS